MSTTFAEVEFNRELLRFRLDAADRIRGLLVMGKQGMGKTQLLSALCLQDIEAHTPVVVFDGEGSLIKELVRRLPVARRNDVVYYAPHPEMQVVPVTFPVSSHTNPIFLIDLSRRTVSHESASRWMDEFLKAAYLAALDRDVVSEKISFALYADASASLFKHSFARLLREMPDLGVACTLALRHASELPLELFEEVNSVLQTKILFALGAHDAAFFEKSESVAFLREKLISQHPGFFVTNFRSRRDGLPLFSARAVTPRALGYGIQEAGLPQGAMVGLPKARARSVKEPEHRGELSRDLLESLLDVQIG